MYSRCMCQLRCRLLLREDVLSVTLDTDGMLCSASDTGCSGSTNRLVWCVVAVPIYDSLGDNAVEYICSHAGVELIFLDVAKLSEFTRVPRCACDERNDWVPLWKAYKFARWVVDTLQLLRCSSRHVGQVAEEHTDERNQRSCRGQLSTCHELFVQTWGSACCCARPPDCMQPRTPQ